MLKTIVRYTEKRPTPSEVNELLDLVPDMSISFEKYEGNIVTEYNPYLKRVDVSWNWLKSLFPKDTDIKCFLTTYKNLEATGVKGYLGLYNLDFDGKHEFYITDDYLPDARITSNGFKSAFVSRFIHELCHGMHLMRYKDAKRAVDEVHQWENEGTLKWHLKDMQDYRKGLQNQIKDLQTKVSLWEQIVKLTNFLREIKEKVTTVETIQHPLKGMYRISQSYGNADSTFYPITGHHIGTDYAVPLGTPVYATCDGELHDAGNSPKLGNNCQFTFKYKGVQYTAQFLHLNSTPVNGSYKQGDVIAVSGNSGMSTGPHLHLAIWLDSVKMNIINQSNWRELTIDPELLFNK